MFISFVFIICFYVYFIEKGYMVVWGWGKSKKEFSFTGFSYTFRNV